MISLSSFLSLPTKLSIASLSISSVFFFKSGFNAPGSFMQGSQSYVRLYVFSSLKKPKLRSSAKKNDCVNKDITIQNASRYSIFFFANIPIGTFLMMIIYRSPRLADSVLF